MVSNRGCHSACSMEKRRVTQQMSKNAITVERTVTSDSKRVTLRSLVVLLLVSGSRSPVAAIPLPAPVSR